MKPTYILSTVLLSLAFVAPASASDDAYCGNPTGKWMSKEAASTIATNKGYSVRRVKREDGCFEVYATNKNGARVELYMNPVSGEIVRVKNKS